MTEKWKCRYCGETFEPNTDNQVFGSKVSSGKVLEQIWKIACARRRNGTGDP